MRRWLAGLFLLVLAGAGVRQFQVEQDSRYSGERGPYLQTLTPTSAVVRWQTDQPEPSILQLQQHSLQAETGPVLQHRIQLRQLQPQTTYQYRVAAASPALSRQFSFTTPPALDDQSAAVRLWVLGDPGAETPLHQAAREAGQQWLRQHRRAAQPLLDLWLSNGDSAYTSGRNHEYQQAIFTPYQDWLGQFALLPAIGNHDLRRRAYRRIFELPENAEQGGVASSSQHYFAIDHGALHAIVLDSEWALVRARTAMLKWLEKDLQANARPWVITVLHHPPYSRGSHDSDDNRGSDRRMGLVRKHLLPLLERYNVDLVIAGHSHAYERSHLLTGHYGLATTLTPRMLLQRGRGAGDAFHKTASCRQYCGTVYQVMGSTAELVAGPFTHPAMAVGLNQGGTLVVDVEPNCLTSRFINASGEQPDYFTIGRGPGCQPAE